MPTSTLTTKGQITLPKQVREKLHLQPGDRVDFVVEADGEIRVRASRTDVRELKGLLHQPGRKSVSLEEMAAAVARAASRRR
jgi:AbrB family looped-hinge helix DNA binding protein